MARLNKIPFFLILFWFKKTFYFYLPSTMERQHRARRARSAQRCPSSTRFSARQLCQVAFQKSPNVWISQFWGLFTLKSGNYGIFGVVGGQLWVIFAHWWWRDVIRPSPDLDLILAVLGRRLGLVQALQTAVHALIQSPSLGHRNPVQVKLLLDQEQGLDGSLQHARVGQIERETSLFQGLKL